MYVCMYVCVCVLKADGVKAERYAVCITSAVLHCLDKLMTDSKFISEFTRTQKEDDNLSFIFRIVSACAHLKEYTIANFSHRNSYIDTVATYSYSTFIYNSVNLLLSLIIFQNYSVLDYSSSNSRTDFQYLSEDVSSKVKICKVSAALVGVIGIPL